MYFHKRGFVSPTAATVAMSLTPRITLISTFCPPFVLPSDPCPGFAHLIAGRLKSFLGGDDAVANLEAERSAAQEALAAATTDEEREAAQAAVDKLDEELTTTKSGNAVCLPPFLHTSCPLVRQWGRFVL